MSKKSFHIHDLNTETIKRIKLLAARHESTIAKVVEDAIAMMDAAIENELAEALDAYTDPKSAQYDPVFDAKVRALRPDWFAGEGR